MWLDFSTIRPRYKNVCKTVSFQQFRRAQNIYLAYLKKGFIQKTRSSLEKILYPPLLYIRTVPILRLVFCDLFSGHVVTNFQIIGMTSETTPTRKISVAFVKSCVLVSITRGFLDNQAILS